MKLRKEGNTRNLANLRKANWQIQFAWIEIRTRSRITKQPRSRNISGYFRLDSFSTSEKLSVYCQIRWNCVAGKYCPVLSAMIYRSSTSKTHLILKCDNSIFSPDTVIVPIVKPPMYPLDYKMDRFVTRIS